MWLDRKRKSFVWVCVKLFWHEIYCTNPRPKPDSYSGSLSRRGLGKRAPRIICEYDIATAISIRPLTQTRTWEMVSSIFSAMSQIKSPSTAMTSFSRIPSTETTNGEKIPLIVAIITVLALLLFFSPSQERFHWLLLVGFTV